MSTKATHTPGPWTARSVNVTRYLDTVRDADNYDVCEVSPRVPPAEASANAELISLSPDHALLLAAIVKGEVAVRLRRSGEARVYAGGEPVDVPLDAFGCPRLTDALRAALSKE